MNRHLHYHVCASTLEGERLDVPHRTYPEALAAARRLVVEALPPQGQTRYYPRSGAAQGEGWAVMPASGTDTVAIVAVFPCSGQHAREEVPALVA